MRDVGLVGVGIVLGWLVSKTWSDADASWGWLSSWCHSGPDPRLCLSCRRPRKKSPRWGPRRRWPWRSSLTPSLSYQTRFGVPDCASWQPAG